MASWTDDRMDDLKGQVVEMDRRIDHRFAHVDHRFEQIDKRFEQVDKRFAQIEQRMDEGFREIRAEIRELNLRFDAMQRVLLMYGAAMFAAMMGLIATQL